MLTRLENAEAIEIHFGGVLEMDFPAGIVRPHLGTDYCSLNSFVFLETT